MYNKCLDSLPWLACFILINMHPWAAIGASFGCCFLLSRPPKNTAWYSVLFLTAFSWGMGYGAGVFFYGDGPPYSAKAMAVASLVSAVAGVVFASFCYAVENKEDLPKWMQNIMDRIPTLRNRGGENGS